MKRIVILGSTGSIGTNTLDIISKFPEKFQAVGLTAGNNVDKLEEQVRTFSPAVVAMADPAAAERLRTRCKGLKTTILNGTDGLTQTATRSEEHTSELQSPCNLVCRLLLEKKKKQITKRRRRGT